MMELSVPALFSTKKISEAVYRHSSPKSVARLHRAVSARSIPVILCTGVSKQSHNGVMTMTEISLTTVTIGPPVRK